MRDQVERRVRLALARAADQLDGVTVRIDQRLVRVEGDARYSCKVAMAPVHMEILEEHGRLETAIDRAARLAAPPVIRNPLPPTRGR